MKLPHALFSPSQRHFWIGFGVRDGSSDYAILLWAYAFLSSPSHIHKPHEARSKPPFAFNVSRDLLLLDFRKKDLWYFLSELTCISWSWKLDLSFLFQTTRWSRSQACGDVMYLATWCKQHVFSGNPRRSWRHARRPCTHCKPNRPCLFASSRITLM